MNSQQELPAHTGFNGREFRLCECIGRSVLNEEVISLDFAWEGPAPKAGQFFLLRPQRTSVFLGRPLSAAGWNLRRSKSRPVEPGILEFILAIRGKGTKELADLRPGEKAFLTGPLGRGWLEVSGAQRPGKTALVSGGVGIAPLAFFAQEQGGLVDFYAGFRSKPFCLENIKAQRIIIASEDGCAGHKGRIPDFFVPDNYDAVFTCGPESMLRTIAKKCRAKGVKCYVSLERHMACGTGACLGCTVETGSGNRRCCSDGPVFDAEDIFA